MAFPSLGHRPRFRADGGRVETIYLYDAIGADFFGEGITAARLVPYLGQLTGVVEIELRINSPGGDVFDAAAIYNALLRNPAKVTSYIDGMAWSAASVIAMAGDSVIAAENASVMIHNPAAILYGDADTLRKVADTLDQTKENLIDAYKRHMSAGRDRISSWMDDETWWNADEAVANGFADATEQAYPIAAWLPKSMQCRHMPNWVKNAKATRPNYDRVAVALESRKRQMVERKGGHIR